MKKLFIAFMALLWIPAVAASLEKEPVTDDLFGKMQAGDKGAVLMVHFGTTYDDTRTKTIDAINQAVQAAFPAVELREAYTSRIVMRRLKARGLEKQNPTEALQRLKAEGFTHILVQSTNVIDGIEMDALRSEVALAANDFKEIRVGNPLLFTPEDYEKVMESLLPYRDPEGATVWVGHGTHDAATAQYAMLDYMWKAKGYADCHVGTVEGYPSIEEVKAKLLAGGKKTVRLIPLMLVAGDHANNDIAGEWKEQLEAAGFEVNVQLMGLGENPGVRQLYVDHARWTAVYPTVNMAMRKKAYANEKD
ncbi:MAG: sirohydrochlorin cobaltochelatase [Parabacteroides sp.]